MSKKRVFASYRESRGYSQKDLAKLLGVKQQAISSWEIGRTIPKPHQLQQIAEALGVTKDELFSDIFQIQKEEYVLCTVKNCGNQMEESAKFCPSCGASQENKEFYTEQISPKIEKSLSEVKAQISKGKQSGNLYKIAGWISVVISLLFIPVLFSAIGVIMGYLYREHDEKHGTILMIAGVAGGVLGTLLGLSSGY